MRLSVVIPTVRGSTLLDAVRSVIRQTHLDWELMLVGQGDDPGLRRALASAAALDPRVRSLWLRERGVSRARNAGIAATSGPVVVLMDDDCEARADWLETVAQVFESEPTVDVVGGSLIAPPPTRRGVSSCPHVEPLEVLYVPSAERRGAPPGCEVLTANLAVRRSTLEAFGGFDERLGPGTEFAAGEDPDLVLRLEAAGCRLRTTPRSVVFHTHGRRYGVRAAFQLARAYAEGQGALAAKLEMMNDVRGREWVRRSVSDLLFDGSRRAPSRLLRASYLLHGYQACRRRYRLDPTRRFLEPLARVPG